MNFKQLLESGDAFKTNQIKIFDAGFSLMFAFQTYFTTGSGNTTVNQEDIEKIKNSAFQNGLIVGITVGKGR